MKNINKLIIYLLVIFIISILLIYLLSINHSNPDEYDQNYESKYHYDIHLLINQTLYNVTFYVPISIKEDTILGRYKIGNETDGIQGGFRNETGWHYSFINTIYGPMLEMKKDKVEPIYDNRGDVDAYYKPDNNSPEITSLYGRPDPFYFQAEETVNKTIDTENPLMKEFLISPKFNLTNITSSINNESYNYLDEPEYLYYFKCPLYATYHTNNTTLVRMIINVEGRNSWTVFIDNYKSNSYIESVMFNFSGSQKSWNKGTGYLKTGIGAY